MPTSIERPLIVFATLAEAEATLRVLSAVKKKENLYKHSHGLILITGMGCLQACRAVSDCLAQEEVGLIWNCGIAASIVDGHALGTILSVGKVDKYLSFPDDVDAHSQQLAERLHPPFLLEGAARLLSSDFPIHHNRLRMQLRQEHDLIDMEGYGICCAAQLHNKPVLLHKLVSDFAKLDGQHLIKAKLAEYSEKLATHIMSINH